MKTHNRHHIDQGTHSICWAWQPCVLSSQCTAGPENKLHNMHCIYAVCICSAQYALHIFASIQSSSINSSMFNVQWSMPPCLTIIITINNLLRQSLWAIVTFCAIQCFIAEYKVAALHWKGCRWYEQCSAVQINIAQCSAIMWNIAQYCVIFCNIQKYCAMLCNIVQ